MNLLARNNFYFFIKLIFFISWLPVVGVAQIHEDFSGNEFNSSGLWQGNTELFTVNAAGQGQLNASAAGSAYFSTPVVWQDSFTFSFYLKLKFAPSNNNKISIYLVSSQSDLNNGGGLMMNIGKNGDSDGVTLALGDQNTSSVISESGAGEFAAGVDGVFKGLIGNQHLKIEFQRPDHSTWTVYDDVLPNGFVLGSQVYFGFLLNYTVSNIRNFYFDDISIGRYMPDTEGPIVSSVSALGLHTLLLKVNEPVVIDELTDPIHYTITNGEGVNISIDSISGNGSEAVIYTADPLNINPNRIKITGLHDLSGNVMADQEIVFSLITYASAEPYGILINEMLPDPTPAIGLPEGEFIELWNASNKTLQLAQYKILKSNVMYTLQKKDFLPGEYLVLVPATEVDKWAEYSGIVGLSSFPTLNNDGTTLTLQDSSGNEIHTVTYDLNSYKDSGKKDGGWSLELAGRDAVCDGKNAWKASVDASGGTPGRENSNKEMPFGGVRIIGIDIVDEYNVQLCLSKSIDFSSQNTKSAFIGVNTPAFKIYSPVPVADCCVLEFDQALEDAIWYEIKLMGDFSDCLGRNIGVDTIVGFGRNFPIPAPGEVIVNEILFNPNTGGYDYVEFYNPTRKIFNLQGLVIANTQGNKTALITKATFIQPENYVAFCQDKAWLSANYTVKSPDNITEMVIPSFNSDMGNVTLFNGKEIIDSFRYSEAMHNIFLTSNKGISLERVSPEQPTNLASNWQSAATGLGGGTPGYVNSQTRSLSRTEKILEKTEEYFSPNQDGYLDQFIVKYHLDKPGYLMRWRVFDAAGRLVKSENSGVLTGVDGFVSWDGSMDDLTKVLPGIYVMEFRFSHDDGTTHRERISCVISY
ncbi:MAG: lamin tail domain-containing protein [Saprospiraceae bacterium]|nr:lamin tail domain-containing protein [Saprospiraceae bacterium]